ncbi:DinG family ATP-dependent helicase YoaA [Streptococcus sp. DD10]|uniref:bifunctional DnaQ family exonuclease/ATP-dependent helicase n=1 Tax=Streptococcus sp. DD10 TaxID=1777878 RepID=UPI000791B2D4|nr:bifunctional DnaQ family exonuclease/ATP-dependent helicase [Streptococcus sp. DD10]KXT74104.1 DinG family ATP-dependent helicase YoaA [Streptococcus sp. DD10]
MTQNNNRYAVVDLEATSPGSNAKIIQVGIVIIEKGEIKTTYETDVNPHEPLSSHIKELTGLTDERLAEAPEFSQVARDIYHLISDCIFVAHNVKFDADLLAEALFWEGFELLSPRVDTVELAQVFYPNLERFNLSVLSENLGLDLSRAHTALSDAQATAQLFLKIQDKIRGLPAPLVESILELSDHLLYETRLAIEEVFIDMSQFSSKDLIETQGIFIKKTKESSKAFHLSKNFDKNMALLGLKVRDQQAVFADFVEKALKEHQISFLQAQTGLGKTYAYLLSALVHSDKKILISVPTKILQDQLLHQEGRNIQETFHTTFHSLKGPRNYIKLEKFYSLLQGMDENRLLNRFKLLLLVWLTETETGDLSEIGQLQRYEAFLPYIQHDGELSKKSLFYAEDFWRIGQEKANSARVIVTNHAYLLTRLEDDKTLIADRLLIVDEAQKLISALESFSRKRLNLNKLLQEIHQEYQQSSTILNRRLLESIQFEINSMLEDYQLVGEKGLNQVSIERMRQDVLELSLPCLMELKDALSSKFSNWWLEEERFDHHRTIWFHASRVDILPFTSFLPKDSQVLFLSATLDISSRVSIADLLGFEQAVYYRLEEEQRNNQQIYVDKDFPSITQLSLEDYATHIIDRLERLKSLNYPILVLFTAKDLLYEVSDRLTLSHLAQGKNGDASNLKKRFERGESQILLGMGSFWEGVDFLQSDRFIEVITRLPFDNPKDPFLKKITDRFIKEGKNSFYDYSLPMMIMKLRQAMGRIQRRTDQFSAVIILDKRVFNKKYGRQIKEQLAKQAEVKKDGFEGILLSVKKFLER